MYLSRRARRRGARGVCSDESEATTQKEPANAKAEPPRLRLPIMRRRSTAAAPLRAAIAASPSFATLKAASSDVFASAMRAPSGALLAYVRAVCIFSASDASLLCGVASGWPLVCLDDAGQHGRVIQKITKCYVFELNWASRQNASTKCSSEAQQAVNINE